MLAPRPGGHKGDAKAPWQRQLARTPREVDAVLEQLGWDDASTGALREASRRFELRVTEHYLGLADPSDPDDPILAQVLPDARELHAPPPGFSADAVGDLRPDNHPAATLVHKYPGRALLVTTGLCAVNCRFCFRRAYPYEETREGPAAALQAIRSDPGVREVILSGGDPLALSDRALGDLLADQIRDNLGIKRERADTFGYLQPSFSGIVSDVDQHEAREVGEKAVAAAAGA